MAIETSPILIAKFMKKNSFFGEPLPKLHLQRIKVDVGVMEEQVAVLLSLLSP